MTIWLMRHGQTDLNGTHRMQGLTDVPLNEKGREQAFAAREWIGGETFDAVYASPLLRARQTASLAADVPMEDIRIDRRLIEMDFGKYEGRKYFKLGPAFWLFWALPLLIPAPKTIETVASLRTRGASFLRELEKSGMRSVLVVTHGGILRALNGYLADRKSGLCWYRRMHNCEVRVYESEGGEHRLLRTGGVTH